MGEHILPLALFTLLPVALGVAIVTFDRTATGPVRRAEAFLVPLFLVGVGGSGIAGFIVHVFIADPAARSMGWEPGSPFQLQVGFAYLALGLAGAVAAERRGGFREATAVAFTVVSIGAVVVALLHFAETGTQSLGIVLLSVTSLVTPILLIWFLLAVRRAEQVEPTTIILRGWMIPVRRGSVAAAAVAGWAYPIGYPVGQPVVVALAGIAVAAAVFWWIVSRAPTHRVRTEP